MVGTRHSGVLCRNMWEVGSRSLFFSGKHRSRPWTGPRLDEGCALYLKRTHPSFSLDGEGGLNGIVAREFVDRFMIDGVP